MAAILAVLVGDEMSKDMILTLKRSVFTDKCTKGEMFANGAHLGYTCEDVDRKIEAGGVKIPDETAIPRGRYRVIISFSNRFQRNMPEVLNVPGFEGVRIHGGNSPANTRGCPLLGAEMTPSGVRDCATINTVLIRMIGATLSGGGHCWLEIV